MPETDLFDCKLCRRSNNVDDMVFCAACQEWYHYQCVGVTSAVANESWMCARCAALPSSTRIGELYGSDPLFPATIVTVSSVKATESSSIVASTSSVVSLAASAGLPLAATAASPITSSTAASGPVPPAIAGPSGWLPTTTTAISATNYGQSLLTDQARASLQWVQEHRTFLSANGGES